MLVVVHQELVDAIREKRLIEFTYKFGSARVVEPHDYGVRRGEASVLGYQLSGPSRSGVAHGWKHFKVDDMRQLQVLDRHFPGSRADNAQQHRQWDLLFARVR
jgi:hypothetical protein